VKQRHFLRAVLFSAALIPCAVQATPQTITFGPDGSSFFTTDRLEVSYLNPYTGEDSHYGRQGNLLDTGYWSVAEATSNSWVAYSPRAYSPSSFSSSSGELFNLDSFWLAGAWGSQTLTITGYANGSVINTTTIGVDIVAQEYFFSGFLGIDTFTIAIGNDYVPNAALAPRGLGQHWTIGSVTVSAVPEPETYAMMLAGLAMIGAVARRRRKTP